MCCRQTACSLSVTGGEVPERLSEGAALAIGVTAVEPPYGDVHGDRAAGDHGCAAGVGYRRRCSDIYNQGSRHESGGRSDQRRACWNRVETIARCESPGSQQGKSSCRDAWRAVPCKGRGITSPRNSTKSHFKGGGSPLGMERSLGALTQCGGLLRDQAGRLDISTARLACVAVMAIAHPVPAATLRIKLTQIGFYCHD